MTLQGFVKASDIKFPRRAAVCELIHSEGQRATVGLCAVCVPFVHVQCSGDCVNSKYNTCDLNAVVVEAAAAVVVVVNKRPYNRCLYCARSRRLHASPQSSSQKCLLGTGYEVWTVKGTTDVVF
jgi:hypothetical protein